jgi:cobalt/nickel transport system permease protein
MHIPDNYLSPSTCAVMGAAMVPVWALSVRKVTREVSRLRMPLLGIAAAFSFLLMMFNVPLPGGTTGHAVGGTLMAIVLGPWSACLSVSVALLIQALLFGDGGVLTFGANCFNMAFVMPFLGFLLYRLIRRVAGGQTGEWLGIVIGSYIAINVAALVAAVEFGIQPLLFRDAAGLPIYCPYPLSVAVPAMLLPHLAVAGIVEAGFTAAIIAFVKRVSPGMIEEGAKQRFGALYGALLAFIFLTPLGILAAGTAWGEWGAEEIAAVQSGGAPLGFVPKAIESGFSMNTLAPDYSLKGIPEPLSYILCALAGAAILVIAFKLLSLLKRKDAAKAAP